MYVTGLGFGGPGDGLEGNFVFEGDELEEGVGVDFFIRS